MEEGKDQPTLKKHDNQIEELQEIIKRHNVEYYSVLKSLCADSIDRDEIKLNDESSNLKIVFYLVEHPIFRS